MMKILILVFIFLGLSCSWYPKNKTTDGNAEIQPRSAARHLPVTAFVFKQIGLASFSADDQHGKPTASGVIYDMRDLVAAHPELPFGTIVKVTNQVNNRSVRVEIIDRGPFVKDRIIDLSFEAAKRLGFVEKGITPVEISIVKLPY
jgi:rare lipoprotein A